MSKLKTVGHALAALPEELPPELRGPDWVQANPRRIEDELAQALALPSGGWYVLDGSRSIGTAPRVFWVAGRELVAWRAGGELRVAPNACPHMGAALADGAVKDGRLVCPWHGLELGAEKHGAWCAMEAHDDGVLCWVRLDDGETTPRPIVSPRPTEFLDCVMRMEADCEPRDVIANRLDPWHGVYYHPHTFKQVAGACRLRFHRPAGNRGRRHVPLPRPAHDHHDHRRRRGDRLGGRDPRHAAPERPHSDRRGHARHLRAPWFSPGHQHRRSHSAVHLESAAEAMGGGRRLRGKAVRASDGARAGGRPGAGRGTGSAGRWIGGAELKRGSSATCQGTLERH